MKKVTLEFSSGVQTTYQLCNSDGKNPQSYIVESTVSPGFDLLLHDVLYLDLSLEYHVASTGTISSIYGTIRIRIVGILLPACTVDSTCTALASDNMDYYQYCTFEPYRMARTGGTLLSANEQF